MTETEPAIRSKYPKLLLEQEHVAFSEFSSLPQPYHFTTHRIIHTIEPSTSGINRRVTHSTIPYTSVQAFSCLVSIKNNAPTVNLYTSGASHTEHKPKSTDPNVNTHSTVISLKENDSSKDDSCFRLISFLYSKMNGKMNETTSSTSSANVSDLIAWIQNTDPADVASKSGSNHPLLSLCPIFDGDEVLESFVSVGDSNAQASICICTNQRLVILNFTTGSKKGGLASFNLRSSNSTASLEIQVIPWSCIGGWTVATTNDAGVTLQLHTIVIDLPKITLSTAASSAAWQIPSALLKAQCETTMAALTTKTSLTTPLPHWITNEAYFLGEVGLPDVSEVERYYRTTVPLLQTNEQVDLLLFGRRHVILFTPHRIVVVDIQRSQGKVANVGYRSLLWTSVIVYGVKMAGQHMDQNTCDLLIYTPMMFDPAAQAGSQPGMSLWELDCHLRSATASADSALLVRIQQYMTLRCAHRSELLPTVRSGIKHDDYCTHLQDLFDQWKGLPDHAAVSQGCQKAFATMIPILLDDEIVVHCHLIGRGDLAIFTNQRVVEVDTQGWSDQRIVFRSVHFANIRGFCFTTDTSEPELQIYTGNLWSLQKFRISYCADDSIMAIAKFLANMTLLKNDSSGGNAIASVIETLRKEIKKPPAPTSDSLSSMTRSLNVKGLLTSVTDNSLEIKDTKEMNQTLRSDIPLLLESERIEHLFQCGRDFFVYTSHRLLYWDVQGIGVTMFTSWPWMYCAGYSVVTCNTALDRDAELYLYFCIPGRQRKKQSILVGSCDIYNMQAYISQKLLV